jgi:hypothetical protein
MIIRMSSSEVLNALATVNGRREELDRAEWLLVAAARRDGATWAEVAAALGLRSRQAAEQRWLRLRGAIGPATDGAAIPGGPRDPRTVRTLRDFEPEWAQRDDVMRLRQRVALVYDLLVQIPVGPRGDPAMRLARKTLAVAGRAPAGALHDLVRLAIDDLRRVPAQSQGPDLVRAGQRLREALDASPHSTIS